MKLLNVRENQEKQLSIKKKPENKEEILNAVT